MRLWTRFKRYLARLVAIFGWLDFFIDAVQWFQPQTWQILVVVVTAVSAWLVTVWLDLREWAGALVIVGSVAVVFFVLRRYNRRRDRQLIQVAAAAERIVSVGSPETETGSEDALEEFDILAERVHVVLFNRIQKYKNYIHMPDQDRPLSWSPQRLSQSRFARLLPRLTADMRRTHLNLLVLQPDIARLSPRCEVALRSEAHETIIAARTDVEAIPTKIAEFEQHEVVLRRRIEEVTATKNLLNEVRDTSKLPQSFVSSRRQMTGQLENILDYYAPLAQARIESLERLRAEL